MKYLSMILLSMTLLSACSENIFDEFADKDTDEAVFFQAKQSLNARNYTEAINLLESLDPAFLTDRARVPIYASAYSGRCGLEFLTLLNTMQNTGAATVIGTLMGAFPGAQAANIQDCIRSEEIVEALGEVGDRTNDENLLMAFNALAKIGAILSTFADTDDDAVADAGFDQCDVNDISDEMVREIGASIAVTVVSLGAIGTSYIDDSLADVNALCALDASLGRFCSITDPLEFLDPEVQALRYAIGSNDFGIDSCGGNDFTNCPVAQPPPCGV
ncbi:MAG: hypothetical protein AAF203_01845 [Pseudomonadota bacterium]